MKNFIKKTKRIDFLVLLDNVLEHKLLKPISISIITTFILINSLSYGQRYFSQSKKPTSYKDRYRPITINISESDSGFDMSEEQIIDYHVKSGDTILKILLDLGANESDIFTILAEMKKVYNPRSITTRDVISINHKVKVEYDKKAKDDKKAINKKVIINSLSIAPSSEKIISVYRDHKGHYQSKEEKVKISKYISKYSTTIKNGLYLDGVRSGVSPTAVMNMINLYSYDVDFQRDVKTGDSFEMLVESYYTEDGKKVKDGNILFSSLKLRKRSKPIDIYLHTANGKSKYYNSKGNSNRKTLLRTPINGARVSSTFGMRRHPVLGYSRMHKGIDFAAPRGTPILAAGDGKITYYSRRGGYGKFVKIRHTKEYSTAYAHASRYVRGLRVGSRVKQGQVIAYVGTTGRSTGPHLHFELIRKGKAVNPSKVKATSGSKLRGKALRAFKDTKNKIDKYRKNIPNQIKISQ